MYISDKRNNPQYIYKHSCRSAVPIPTRTENNPSNVPLPVVRPSEQFTVLVQPIPRHFAHVRPSFPALVIINGHSENPLYLKSVLCGDDGKITFLVRLAAKRVFERQFGVAVRAMATLRLCLVPPMTAIEAGRLSARCTKSVMSDGMPERPFCLFLRDRQQPPVGGYYLMLKFCPCFHGQKSKSESSVWVFCTALAVGFGLLWRCCILRISSS